MIFPPAYKDNIFSGSRQRFFLPDRVLPEKQTVAMEFFFVMADDVRIALIGIKAKPPPVSLMDMSQKI
ncbi:MAG: hypothetical protein OEZ36_11750 [Spirochaetota bacterium]|nr:hypothetical protein [Spirochaetota bacterium]